MVNIEAGVAEAGAVTMVAKVYTIIRNALVAVLSNYPRPFVRTVFMQGSTSRSAVSPDYTLNGGMPAVV